MNRRTAEQGTAEYRSEKHFLILSKTSAVRNSLFDIVLRTPHPAGGSPVSIFKIREVIVGESEWDRTKLYDKSKESRPRGPGFELPPEAVWWQEVEFLTGRVVCPPRLKKTGGEINGGAAFSTLVSFIELVREYLLLCSATVTFADK